ncbi:MAG: hypothetical protein NTY96_05375 [Bacteroidetes bacterium]|nr:hypothetical protein [Bacteroidota bacterium]
MKTRLFLGYFILLVIFLSLIFSCRKDFSRQAAVVTNGFDKPSATASGKVIDMGKGPMADHGFCWDTNGFPNLSSQTKSLGPVTQTGNYTSVLDSLRPNKIYYIKAFILVNGSPEYGELLSFLTPDLPTVLTDSVYNITDSSAVSENNITADGGASVLSRGTCWGKNPGPGLSGEHSSDGTGTGKFTSNISKLNAGSKYYIRAYAKNFYGIRYGEEIVLNTVQTATLPIISTSDITSMQINSAVSGGNVQSDGGAIVTARGVCWSTNPYPTINDSKTTDGAGTGSYTSNLSGLTANTKYYLRAWATNSKGTGYGEEKSFTTLPNPGIPAVTTSAVTGITSTTATSGGVVLDDGGASVTSRGVCWSTNPSPTTSDSKTNDGSGPGSFSSQITGLNNGTKYYVRAYAVNSVGTAYGNEIGFTAGQSITTPTVTTTEVVNISQTTAGCGGNVTSDGGASVTARGVCWSIFDNPTITNSHTTDGSGTGGFISSVTGLFSATTYYIRAYATNSAGTSYGNTRIFTTLQEVTFASVTTAPVTNITNNSATSGGTVTNDGGATVTTRGVCWSTGYNPTIADPHTSDGSGTGSFTSQITGLQSNTFYRVRAYATNSAGTAYGNQQTFSTLQDPILPTVTTTQPLNITQTTATSGGTVMSDGGSPVSARGVCWSTSPGPTTANSHTLDGTGTGSFVSNLTGLTPGTQYYVRAYATNGVGTAYGNEYIFITQSAATLPTLTTTAATNITQTTATSGGNVTFDGGSSVSARGVCWSTTSNPTTTNSHTSDGSGTGTFVSNLTGLTANTLYYVRAYATNGVGTAYGNEVTFTTLPLPWQCGDTIQYTGQVYNTVLIGTQCWMKENLNVGTMIAGTQNQTNNNIIEKYCYNDDTSYCSVYGGLYQWDEMMQYTTSEGTKGICPINWHLPSDAEWATLTSYLGSASIAGGKMKETGTLHWSPPNTGATNSSGFTALPGGAHGGGFGSLTYYAHVWSSSQNGSSGCAYVRNLNYADVTVEVYCYDKSNGFSARCVKN